MKNQKQKIKNLSCVQLEYNNIMNIKYRIGKLEIRRTQCKLNFLSNYFVFGLFNSQKRKSFSQLNQTKQQQKNKIRPIKYMFFFRVTNRTSFKVHLAPN